MNKQPQEWMQRSGTYTPRCRGAEIRRELLKPYIFARPQTTLVFFWGTTHSGQNTNIYGGSSCGTQYPAQKAKKTENTKKNATEATCIKCKVYATSLRPTSPLSFSHLASVRTAFTIPTYKRRDIFSQPTAVSGCRTTRQEQASPSSTDHETKQMATTSHCFLARNPFEPTVTHSDTS